MYSSIEKGVGEQFSPTMIT